jgi:hypothetical protein
MVGHPLVPGLYYVATRLVAVYEEPAAIGISNEGCQTLRAALTAVASGQTPVRESGQPVSAAEIVASAPARIPQIRAATGVAYRQPDVYRPFDSIFQRQADLDQATAGRPSAG